MKWVKDHSTLLGAVVLAIIFTTISGFVGTQGWKGTILANIAAEGWGAALIFLLFDITPRTVEKRKQKE